MVNDNMMDLCLNVLLFGVVVCGMKEKRIVDHSTLNLISKMNISYLMLIHYSLSNLIT